MQPALSRHLTGTLNWHTTDIQLVLNRRATGHLTDTQPQGNVRIGFEWIVPATPEWRLQANVVECEDLDLNSHLQDRSSDTTLQVINDSSASRSG
jgi:hypothetical protein